MNFSAVLDALYQASAFESHRLRDALLHRVVDSIADTAIDLPAQATLPLAEDR